MENKKKWSLWTARGVLLTIICGVISNLIFNWFDWSAIFYFFISILFFKIPTWIVLLTFTVLVLICIALLFIISFLQ